MNVVKDRWCSSTLCVCVCVCVCLCVCVCMCQFNFNESCWYSDAQNRGHWCRMYKKGLEASTKKSVEMD